MKNAIKYYYNLNPDNLIKVKNIYRFTIDNDHYALIDITEKNKNINDVYNMSIELNNKGIYTHQFVLNVQNNIQTYINDNIYVMLKTLDKMDKTITFEDVINFSNATTNIKINTKLKRNNWYDLWIKKMDYFEYQISQIGKKFPFLTESFSYFEGIVETGIALLNYEKIESPMISICHNRINKKDTLFDLYNPFNFIVDVKIRDVVEYIKENMLQKDSDLLLDYYLNNNKLNDTEYKLFFIRLLYPTFYFDIYEKIINNELEETEIVKCIDQIQEYEQLIKKTYARIKLISTLSEIEWIKKM